MTTKSLSKVEITPDDLCKFSKILHKYMGLSFGKNQERDLRFKLSKIVKALGFQSGRSCIDFLLKNPLTKKHIITFAKELTVGETYFFRHQATFDALEKSVLPQIISKKREKGKDLRIWSAGCCTGEEPYSIAILLQRLIPDLKEWNLTLIGTDINPDFLAKAKTGIYREWSFRETPSLVRKQYFKPCEGQQSLLDPKIREMVTFSESNLTDQFSVPPLSLSEHFDLVLCNNVLFYFSEKHIESTVNKLTESLTQNGWLIVSSVEAPTIVHKMLQPEVVDQVTFFRKTRQKKEFPSQKLIKKPEPLLEIPPASEERPLTKETEKNIRRKIQDLANQGHLLEAKKLCEEAIRADRVDPILYYIYAVVLMNLDDPQEAIRSLKGALFLDSNFVMAYFTLGNLMLQLGHVQEAKRHFRNTLEILKQYEPEQILPGTDDIEAERLRSMAESLVNMETIF